jgi:hypothetical protein
MNATRPALTVASTGGFFCPGCRQLPATERLPNVRCGSLTDLPSNFRAVRFTPESGYHRRPSPCPLSAMCGRLRVGKSFLHVLQSWSVQPCVRPINAVHMTAGHNALRGSGPGQKPAFDNAVAHVGCPDRRIDRLCITCCSPSPTFTLRRVSARSRYAASATGSL